MRLKTTIATLACGLLMMYGGIGYKANEKVEQVRLSSIQEIILDKCEGYDQLVDGGYITRATKFFNNNSDISLAYLKFALDEKVPKNYDSNEITRTTEKVINEYSGCSRYHHLLLELAKEADKYERKETARDILKEELEDLDERDCSDSFKYHLWMVYGIELGKTDSIEATHKNLEDFYKKDNLSNYNMATHVFGQIERKFPENNSRFEDMVIQKNNFGQIFSKLL